MKHARRKPTYFSRTAARHPFSRSLVALLALVQIIAPSWHVCEMSGKCHSRICHGARLCHNPIARGPSVQAAIRQAPVFRCAHCRPANPKVGVHGAFLDDAETPGGFRGTCLARELMGMGRVTVASLTLDFQWARLRAPRPLDVPSHEADSLPQPPSRGPPLCL